MQRNNYYNTNLLKMTPKIPLMSVYFGGLVLHQNERFIEPHLSSLLSLIWVSFEHTLSGFWVHFECIFHVELWGFLDPQNTSHSQIIIYIDTRLNRLPNPVSERCKEALVYLQLTT